MNPIRRPSLVLSLIALCLSGPLHATTATLYPGITHKELEHKLVKRLEDIKAHPHLKEVPITAPLPKALLKKLALKGKEWQQRQLDLRPGYLILKWGEATSYGYRIPIDRFEALLFKTEPPLAKSFTLKELATLIDQLPKKLNANLAILEVQRQKISRDIDRDELNTHLVTLFHLPPHIYSTEEERKQWWKAADFVLKALPKKDLDRLWTQALPTREPSNDSAVYHEWYARLRIAHLIRTGQTKPLSPEALLFSSSEIAQLPFPYQDAFQKIRTKKLEEEGLLLITELFGVHPHRALELGQKLKDKNTDRQQQALLTVLSTIPANQMEETANRIDSFRIGKGLSSGSISRLTQLESAARNIARLQKKIPETELIPIASIDTFKAYYPPRIQKELIDSGTFVRSQKIKRYSKKDLIDLFDYHPGARTRFGQRIIEQYHFNPDFVEQLLSNNSSPFTPTMLPQLKPERLKVLHAIFKRETAIKGQQHPKLALATRYIGNIVEGYETLRHHKKENRLSMKSLEYYGQYQKLRKSQVRRYIGLDAAIPIEADSILKFGGRKLATDANPIRFEQLRKTFVRANHGHLDEIHSALLKGDTQQAVRLAILASQPLDGKNFYARLQTRYYNPDLGPMVIYRLGSTFEEVQASLDTLARYRPTKGPMKEIPGLHHFALPSKQAADTPISAYLESGKPVVGKGSVVAFTPSKKLKAAIPTAFNNLISPNSAHPSSQERLGLPKDHLEKLAPYLEKKYALSSDKTVPTHKLATFPRTALLHALLTR